MANTFASFISFSENYKNSNTKPTHGRHILGNRGSQVCTCVESYEKSPVEPRSHECDNKQAKFFYYFKIVNYVT